MAYTVLNVPFDVIEKKIKGHQIDPQTLQHLTNGEGLWEQSGGKFDLYGSLEKIARSHGISVFPKSILEEIRKSNIDKKNALIETLMTDSFIRVSREMMGGKELKIPSRLDSPEQLERWLVTLPPQNKEYDLLRKQLPEFERQAAAEASLEKMNQTPFHKDSKGAESNITILRDRMTRMGYLDSKSVTDKSVFDSQLEDAVKRFQTDNSLIVDGKVGPKVRDRIHTYFQDSANKIRASMSTLRQTGSILPDNSIVINVAAAKLDARISGKNIESNVIVGSQKAADGKPHETPTDINGKVTDAIFHKTWVIPESISRIKEGGEKTNGIPERPNGLHDVLADVTQNKVRGAIKHPDYRQHIKKDSKGNITQFMSPYSGQVYGLDKGFFTVASTPDNPLGSMKVQYTDNHGTGIHSTLQKGLGVFGQQDRSQSFGCIRAEAIAELTAALIKDPDLGKKYGFADNLALTQHMMKTTADKKGWEPVIHNGQSYNFNDKKVETIKGIGVRTKYQTAFLHNVEKGAGKVRFANDVYKRDDKTLERLNQMGGAELKDGEVTFKAAPQTETTAPASAPPDQTPEPSARATPLTRTATATPPATSKPPALKTAAAIRANTRAINSDRDDFRKTVFNIPSGA